MKNKFWKWAKDEISGEFEETDADADADFDSDSDADVDNDFEETDADADSDSDADADSDVDDDDEEDDEKSGKDLKKWSVKNQQRKFWKWAKNEISGENVLRLEGVIAQETWLGDGVSPKQFRDELNACTGDIEIWINSPGGDVFAASQIYTMLMEYKGNVTVKIDGIAASAASVIAMAGTTVAMSPTSNMMIHNPFTMTIGDEDEMRNTAEFLAELKASIINAYELKTGLSREKISELMTAETWMNAKKALELGFCDKILYTDKVDTDTTTAMLYSPLTVYNSIRRKISAKKFNSKQNSPHYKHLKNIISATEEVLKNG